MKAHHLCLHAFVCIGLFALSPIYVHGQQETGPSRKYMRPAWTTMTAPSDNSNERAVFDGFTNLRVPDKFDEHGIGVKPLEFNTATEKAARDQAISQAIGPYTADVIARWFDRDTAGTMSAQMILDRGQYSETDLDRIINLLSAVDRSGAQGWQLLDHTFIVVYDVTSVKKTSETKASKTLNALNKMATAQANAKGGTKKATEKTVETEGWKVQYRADLYRLDWTDSVEWQFGQRYWNDRKSPTPEKVAAWSDARFPVKKVHGFTATVGESRIKSEGQPPLETLLPACAAKMQSEAIRTFSKQEADLRPRAGIVSDYPLHAKLGEKESVHTNARFVAYKFKQGKKGTQMKRMGVTRAFKVEDNRSIADGRSVSSVFQQQGGRGLELGYVLEERRDLGMNISGGWVLGDAISTGPELTYKSNVLGTLTKFPNFYVGVRFALPSATGLDASGLVMPRIAEGSSLRGNKITPGLWGGSGFQWGFMFSKEFYPWNRGNIYLEPTIAYSWLTFSLNKNNDSKVSASDLGLDPKAFSYKAGMFSMGCGIAHHFGPFALELRPMIGIRGTFKYNVSKEDKSSLESASVTGGHTELTSDAESIAKLFGRTNLSPSVMASLKIRF